MKQCKCGIVAEDHISISYAALRLEFLFCFFPRKSKECCSCGAKWESHEEKETNVNLALALLDMAYKDLYDHAFILSGDSDLAPAVHKVKQNFPRKTITIFAPYNYHHSAELIKGSDNHKTIKYKHIATSLFPADIYDA